MGRRRQLRDGILGKIPHDEPDRRIRQEEDRLRRIRKALPRGERSERTGDLHRPGAAEHRSVQQDGHIRRILPEDTAQRSNGSGGTKRQEERDHRSRSEVQDDGSVRQPGEDGLHNALRRRSRHRKKI